VKNHGLDRRIWERLLAFRVLLLATGHGRTERTWGGGTVVGIMDIDGYSVGNIRAKRRIEPTAGASA